MPLQKWSRWGGWSPSEWRQPTGGVRQLRSRGRLQTGCFWWYPAPLFWILVLSQVFGSGGGGGRLGRQVYNQTEKWEQDGGRWREKKGGGGGGGEERDKSGTAGLISFCQLRNWKHISLHFSAYITHLTQKGLKHFFLELLLLFLLLKQAFVNLWGIRVSTESWEVLRVCPAFTFYMHTHRQTQTHT